MTSLSPILGKWTKLENNGNTCRTDTKIGICSILKVRNPKMNSSFRYFQNFTTCCDVKYQFWCLSGKQFRCFLIWSISLKLGIIIIMTSQQVLKFSEFSKTDFIFGFLDEKSIKMPSCNLTSQLLRIISTLQFVNYIGTCIGEMSFWPQ